MAIAYESSLTFARTVQERCGEPISRCYFCQKCSAGCPVAYAMDLKPAQVIRLMQLGQKDAVLGSPAIWLCVGCETCGTRCPNHIRLAPMYDTLRTMAMSEGYKPDRVIFNFHRSFLDSIRLWGRVHELSMLAEYKLRSPFGSDLKADIGVGLTLLIKGKILSLPERIHGLAQVRKLYEASHSATEVEK